MFNAHHGWPYCLARLLVRLVDPTTCYCHLAFVDAGNISSGCVLSRDSGFIESIEEVQRVGRAAA